MILLNGHDVPVQVPSKYLFMTAGKCCYQLGSKKLLFAMGSGYFRDSQLFKILRLSY